MPEISVSIVSHGHGRLVQDLLLDLSIQTIAKDIEVIVTQNIPEPPLDLSRFQPLKIKVLTNDTPKGFGANHNQAFEHTTNPVFCVVNPDIRINDQHAFEKLLSELDPETGILAPTIVSPAGELEDSVRLNLSPWSIASRVLFGKREKVAVHQAKRPQPFFWAAGMFLTFHSKTFSKIKGFNEKFFMYCEDFDINARVYFTGMKLKISKRVRVQHDARRDSHRSLKFTLWHVRSLFRVWTSRAVWHIAFLHFASICFRRRQ